MDYESTTRRDAINGVRGCVLRRGPGGLASSITMYYTVFQTKDSHAQDSSISPLHTSPFNLLVLDAPYTERYVRCGERTGAYHPLLLDMGSGICAPGGLLRRFGSGRRGGRVRCDAAGAGGIHRIGRVLFCE